MKLSEILGWSKKSKISRGHHFWSDVQLGFGEAITACDREIDRDALREELSDFLNHYSLPKYRLSADEAMDKFISTMPTWLRKVDGK